MQGLVFLGDRRVAVQDFPDPVPGHGDVVVAIRASMPSGTTITRFDAPPFMRTAMSPLGFGTTNRIDEAPTLMRAAALAMTAVSEPPEGGRREELEVGSRHADDGLEALQVRQEGGKLFVVDRLGVAGNALVDPLEMRARVRPDGESGLREKARDHAGRGALAVRSRDVDDGIAPLRIAEQLDELAHAFERQAFDPACGGLEVDVTIEPGQSVSERHVRILASRTSQGRSG